MTSTRGDGARVGAKGGTRARRLASAAFGAALATACLAGPAAWAAPENDHRADATTIPALPYTRTLDIRGATLEPGEMPEDMASVAQRMVVGYTAQGRSACPSPGIARSVWFRYTPAADAEIRADTVGSDFDTVVNTYVTGPAGAMPVACSDDDVVFAPRSKVLFRAEAGRTYFFQVAQSRWAYDPPAATRLVFSVRSVGPAANDAFVSARAIVSAFADDVGMLGASVEPGEPQPSCLDSPGARPASSHVEATVWYALTSAETAVYRLDDAGTDFFAVIAVYERVRSSGVLAADLAERACRGAVSMPGRPLDILVRAGETILVQAGRRAVIDRTPSCCLAGGGGELMLRISRL